MLGRYLTSKGEQLINKIGIIFEATKIYWPVSMSGSPLIHSSVIWSILFNYSFLRGDCRISHHSRHSSQNYK
jgi:hypothetical protein